MPASFDAEYRSLQEAGFEGWGGMQFVRRRNGWRRHLTRLQKSGILPLPPKTVLELGSGNGMVAAMLAADGFAVHGVEISPSAVTWAKQLFYEASLTGYFRQGDVRAMPYFHSGQFDLIVDGNCFHCLIGDDRFLCLTEVHRLLAPGGVFIISSMCGQPRSAEALARFDPVSRCLFEDGLLTRSLLPASEIVRELEEAGFQVISEQVAENSWWDHLEAVATLSDCDAPARDHCQRS